MRKDLLSSRNGLFLDKAHARFVQYSPNHPVTTGVFFEEFSDYLESIILSSEPPPLITGDFNIHVNVVGGPHRLELLELLETMGLQQHVTNARVWQHIGPNHNTTVQRLGQGNSHIGLSHF